MTREILFRGFHPCEDGDTTIYVDGEAVKGRWVGGGYWINDTVTRQTPHIIDFDGNSICVLLSTVCQYTGLTDKNGRKIFEGDILDEEKYEFRVVYEKEWAKFKLQHDNKAIQYPEWNRGTQMKIIGTIWDKEHEHER